MNKDSNDNSLFKLFVLLIIIALIYFVVNKEIKLFRDGIFSIAYTTNTIKYPKRALAVEFYFYYLGKKYEGEGKYIDNMKIRNGRYFIKFCSKNPTNYKLIYFSVPDSIKVAPSEGWNKLPIEMR